MHGWGSASGFLFPAAIGTFMSSLNYSKPTFMNFILFFSAKSLIYTHQIALPQTSFKNITYLPIFWYNLDGWSMLKKKLLS